MDVLLAAWSIRVVIHQFIMSECLSDISDRLP
jgi:hypothetical protein